MVGLFPVNQWCEPKSLWQRVIPSASRPESRWITPAWPPMDIGSEEGGRDRRRRGLERSTHIPQVRMIGGIVGLFEPVWLGKGLRIIVSEGDLEEH